MKFFNPFFFLFLLIFIIDDISAESVNHEKVIICGVCRNTEKAFENTKQNMVSLGEKFKDYAIVVYENNSTDDTPNLYQNWANENPRVNFVTEILPIKKGLTKKEIFETRIQILSIARNKLLNLIKDTKYNDYKYVVMVDLDFMTSWPIKEIVNTLLVSFQWDCISANGIKAGRYYDRYAFRDSNCPFGPEIIDSSFWKMLSSNSFKLTKTKSDNYFLQRLKKFALGIPIKQFYPVYSAFGGLAIYKRKTLIRYSYSGVVTQDLKKYYEKTIFPSISPDNNYMKEYLNLNNISYVEAIKQPIFYEANKDPLINPVACCEHIPLQASMALHGHGKFYINANLKMFYK